MNIGIDIDNTITHTSETILAYARVYGQQLHLNTSADLREYYLEKAMGWDDKTIEHFFSTYLTEIYRHVLPKDNAREVIKDLRSNKHKVVLITSRNKRQEDIVRVTLDWLSVNNIEFDKLVMNNTENMHHFSKLEECMENSIDLMIEDHHDLCLELSGKIPVIMFDYPYNAHLSMDNITRVSNWLEVKAIINNM